MKNKLDLFIYEINHNDLLSESNIDFDKLVDKLLGLNDKERKIVISKLDDETKEKIEKLIEGGIL